MIEFLKTPTRATRRFKKRTKHKQCIKNHVAQLRKSFSSTYKQQLERIRNSVEEIEFEVLPEKKEVRELVYDLFGFKKNDKVLIRKPETGKVVAEGSIIEKKSEFRIKLHKPLRKETDFVEGKNKLLIQASPKDAIDRKLSNETAIRRFQNAKCSGFLHSLILNDYSDAKNVRYSKCRLADAEKLPKLKGKQIKAARNAMMRRISLVEGVAGGGKSLVAAHIIHSLCRYRKSKILFCSPVESSVKSMLNLIGSMRHLTVVNIASKQLTSTRNDLEELIDTSIFNETWKRLSRSRGNLLDKRELRARCSNVMRKASGWYRNKIEKNILKQADVVCCTLSDIAHASLNSLKFDVLILDDTHLTTESECFTPLMTKGLKQVILISEVREDIRYDRLSSNTATMDSSYDSMNRRFSRKCKHNSNVTSEKVVHFKPDNLFERLVNLMGSSSVDLTKQYRMHESVASFPKKHFYLSNLQMDDKINKMISGRISSDVENSSDKFDWLPKKQVMTAIFPVEKNSNSLEKLKKVCSKLIDCGKIDCSRIGIICNNRIRLSEDLGPEIGTVEDFVGRDKDYIILCSLESESKFTTSNQNLEVDYEKSDNILNIALTRAKLGLFIIANMEASKDCCKSWLMMLDYYSDNELHCG